MKCKKRKRKVVERAAEVVVRAAEVVERVVEVVERVVEAVLRLHTRAVDVQCMLAKMKNLNLFIAKAKLIKPH